MGLFNRFPYTNFHELNLDWIIEKVKEMNAQAVQVSSEANNKSTESLAKSLQALTTSENALNTANDTNQKATQALDTANDADQKATQALDTANGIDEKATRALNNSTSAVNTANGIDAKATQALNIAKEKYGGLFTGDLNNLKRPGTYYCSFSNTTNSPYTSGNFGLVEVLTPSENEEICAQRITLLDNQTSGTLTVNMSYRFYVDSAWSPWRKLLVNSAV